MDLQVERPPFYKHIEQNEFSFRKCMLCILLKLCRRGRHFMLTRLDCNPRHKKQKEEDIAICVCRYDAADPDSACGESCLNVLTSTECTPGYCPCDIYCKNQRFQKSQYVKSKLFKTEGRGWGLLADEDIKAGQFVIEYCGEVISWKEARRRSQAYEALGLKDAFIISLNAYESIDATKMGSFARFINHSCQPNCETRKWTVLGEIRVGIFAKQDISAGMELSYDYNFEWYGGAKVRCLCGASCCSGFLGAKSRGFQEDTYLWEDDDNRYSVEDIPLYDTEEDEPTSKLLKTNDFLEEMSNGSGKTDLTLSTDHVLYTEYGSHSMPISVVPLNSIPPGETLVSEGNTDIKDHKFQPQSTTHAFVHKNEGISRVRSNSYEVSGPLYRKILHRQGGKVRHLARKQGKQVNVENFGQLLAPKEAQEEVFSAEEARSLATSQLNSLYDEIRPAIEEHEKDSQDCVSTTVAEKWIEASCHKMKADFNLYSIIIKHAICTPRRPLYKATPKPELENENEIKCIEMGEEVVAADKSG